MEKSSLKTPPPHQPLGKRTAFMRFLDAVEWLGNLLPHPVTLFALFAFAIVLLSGLGGYFEWSALDPRPEGARGRSADGLITAVSLLNGDGLRRIVENLVTNFTSFVPLGTVLVALLGVGVAEHSGLISAAIRGLVLKAASFQPSYLNKDEYPGMKSSFVGNAFLNLIILLQKMPILRYHLRFWSRLRLFLLELFLTRLPKWGM
jgi:hypothetical protein